MKKIFSLVIAIAVIFCSYSSVDGWPQRGNNPQYTGQISTVIGPQTANIGWTLSVGQCGLFSGVTTDTVNGEEVLVLGTKKGVKVITPQGIKIKEIDTSKSIETIVAISNENIYFSAGESLVLRSLTDTSKHWSHCLGTNLSTPTLSEFGDKVYLNASDKGWCFNDSGFEWMTPVLAKGTNDKNVSPTVDKWGNIYIPTMSNPAAYYDTRLYCFYPNGVQKFMKEILCGEPTGVHGTATAVDSLILFWTYPSTTWPSSLIAMKDSVRQWQKSTKIRYSSLAAYDSTIIFCGDAGTTCCSKRDGSTIWVYDSGPITISSPAIDADGTIYVANDKGVILAISKDGVLKWSYDTKQGPMGSPAIGSNGSIYFNSLSGILYALTKPIAAEEIGILEKGKINISPNPCSYICQITGVSEKTSITVHDITGQFVKSIKGFTWNGTDAMNRQVPNGMYFFNMKMGNTTITKKLIWMK